MSLIPQPLGCTRHATSGSLKDSESDSARWYRRAEFHEAEIHLDSFHACDDSGCKMPQWKPAYSHGKSAASWARSATSDLARWWSRSTYVAKACQSYDHLWGQPKLVTVPLQKWGISCELINQLDDQVGFMNRTELSRLGHPFLTAIIAHKYCHLLSFPPFLTNFPSLFPWFLRLPAYFSTTSWCFHPATQFSSRLTPCKYMAKMECDREDVAFISVEPTWAQQPTVEIFWGHSYWKWP